MGLAVFSNDVGILPPVIYLLCLGCLTVYRICVFSKVSPFHYLRLDGAVRLRFFPSDVGDSRLLLLGRLLWQSDADESTCRYEHLWRSSVCGWCSGFCSTGSTKLIGPSSFKKFLALLLACPESHTATCLMKVDSWCSKSCGFQPAISHPFFQWLFNVSSWNWDCSLTTKRVAMIDSCHAQARVHTLRRAPL